eukprot:1193556-Prorocentrum_minimum.AAC.4
MIVENGWLIFLCRRTQYTLQTLMFLGFLPPGHETSYTRPQAVTCTERCWCELMHPKDTTRIRQIVLLCERWTRSRRERTHRAPGSDQAAQRAKPWWDWYPHCYRGFRAPVRGQHAMGAVSLSTKTNWTRVFDSPTFTRQLSKSNPQYW